MNRSPKQRSAPAIVTAVEGSCNGTDHDHDRAGQSGDGVKIGAQYSGNLGQQHIAGHAAADRGQHASGRTAREIAGNRRFEGTDNKGYRGREQRETGGFPRLFRGGVWPRLCAPCRSISPGSVPGRPILTRTRRNAATELAYRSDEANFNPGPHRVDARRLRVEPFLRSRQITTFGRLANSLGTCEASGFDGGTSRSPACSPLAPASHVKASGRPDGQASAIPEASAESPGFRIRVTHNSHPKRTSAQDGRFASMLRS